MPTVSVPFPATVISCRGPRATERALLAEIERLRPRRLGELAAPLRVVVPSASLRRHLGRRLMVEHARALAGITLQTLAGAALEIVERAGETRLVGEATFQILVRRRARAAPLLRRELADLEDGYRAVEGAVRDLLDAGFEAPHREVVEDKLASLAGLVTPRRLQRVGELARVAAAVSEDLEDLGVCRLAQVPQLATAVLRTKGPSVLPSRAVLVHGFADATGVASDLIEALLTVLGGALLLDRPPDPADPGRDDVGVAFLERFAGRFGAFAARTADRAVRPGRVAVMEAPTREAEIRHLASKVRALLDGGAVPEEIGVVARELAPVASLVRRHFSRLGIPLAGAGAALPGGEAWRRSRMLAELLRGGAEATAELWVEARRSGAGGDGELLPGLRALGAVRLADVATLAMRRLPEERIELPLPAPPDGGEPAPRRQVASSRLREATREGAALLRWLTDWPAAGSASTHLGRTLGVLTRLGWEMRAAPVEPAVATLSQLAAQLPEGLELGRDEWIEEAARRLEHVGAAPLGGLGGGVQVLTAMEARGRTFEHLFVVGLNRGVFPRVVQEDALLPDTVRGHLAAEVLREFPVRARGLDEERYLFAQLTAAAGVVDLSLSASVDGAKASPSPFVVRLCREGQVRAVPVGDVLHLPPADRRDPLAPRPAFEHALLAAHRTGRAGLAPLLAAARDEGRARAALERDDGTRWAEARLRVLEEIDAVGAAAGPGPWAGLMGAAAWSGRLPSVTALELIAACPFQALLVRRLRVEEGVDPRHGLPDPGGAGLGLLVHGVLERIVTQAGAAAGGSLIELETRPPTAVPWPSDDDLGRLLRDQAAAVAGALGMSARGLAMLLAARARPFLEVARRADWGTGDMAREVLGAEVSGEAAVDGVDEPLRFRADRVDRAGDGLLLVDYKTGRPPSGAKGEGKRQEHLLEKIARGSALQGPAYAAAASSQPTRGRYLYLRPDISGPEASRLVETSPAVPEMEAAFSKAVAVIARAWRSGAFFPRVEEANGAVPSACRWCEVREACLRDDSGFRSRLVDWVGSADTGTSEVARSAAELWWLGRDRPEEGP